MKKKILFIDRDGTLIKEPPVDYQVDSLEKLEFYPGVFRNLYYIKKNLDFLFVMVSNQDGLGTNLFPEDTFWPSQNKMLKAFENEGITFDAIHIDPSMPADKSPARKPETAMLTQYFSEEYDLTNSYVIGDRITDIQLAKNLGAKGIFLASEERSEEIEKNGLSSVCALITPDWEKIYGFLSAKQRKTVVARKTNETDIYVEVDLDGSGKAEI